MDGKRRAAIRAQPVRVDDGDERAGERGVEDLPLHRIGVLELVDEHHREAVAQRGGRPSGVGRVVGEAGGEVGDERVEGRDGGAAPTGIEYRFDSGAWVAATSPTIAGGNFGFTVTAPAAGPHTISVRETTAPSGVRTFSDTLRQTAAVLSLRNAAPVASRSRLSPRKSRSPTVDDALTSTPLMSRPSRSSTISTSSWSLSR